MRVKNQGIFRGALFLDNPYPTQFCDKVSENRHESWALGIGAFVDLSMGFLLGTELDGLEMWLKQFHKPSPSHHHFYRWYKLTIPRKMGGLWHCFSS